MNTAEWMMPEESDDVVDVTLYESVVNPERVETRLGDLEGLRFD